MESEEIKRDVEELIREVMVNEGHEEYDLNFEGKTEAGDNYAGVILFIKITTKDSKDTYSLVAKTAKRDKSLKKWMPVDMVYDREVFMYSKVFPTFRKLIKETSAGLSFDFVPKAYSISGTTSKQTIVFENLKSRGFKLHDRKKPWTLEHSMLAMERYGEFHALSLALRDQKPEEFEELAGQMSNIAKEFNKNMDVEAFVAPALAKTMELLRKNGREDLAKKYGGLIEEVKSIVNHDVEKEIDKIVIGHLDCWNNNFMFRYQDEGGTKPSSICLLDFQLSQCCSPVIDLSYNIYSTCDKTSLDHFELLLKTYHNSLSGSLRKLGSDPENLFTFDQLKEHWKMYGNYGLITALMVLKICLVEKEDVPDFSELSEKSESVEEFSNSLNIPVKNEEEYDRRTLDVFLHFGDNFL